EEPLLIARGLARLGGARAGRRAASVRVAALTRRRVVASSCATLCRSRRRRGADALAGAWPDAVGRGRARARRRLASSAASDREGALEVGERLGIEREAGRGGAVGRALAAGRPRDRDDRRRAGEEPG